MDLKVFDSHCHPQLPQYDDDRVKVLQRALDSGIGMICVGTDLEMSRKAVQLAETHEGVWASVGLHPNDNLQEQYDDKGYRELFKSRKAVALGEVGLDYYRTTGEENKKFQRERFEKQIQLAVEIKKPLIIHCREAHRDMLGMLSRYREGIAGAVIHSFTGTYDDAKAYTELGFMIGFNGIITFARNYDESVKGLPVDNILLETDAPFLSPVPYRGKRNEPAFVIEVAKMISRLRDLPYEEIIEKSTQNIKRLLPDLQP